jgi:hypothetical protein
MDSPSSKPGASSFPRLVSDLLPNGGPVRWATLRAAADGSVQISPQGIDWQSLLTQLGDTAVLEHQGWAVGTVDVGTTTRVRLSCHGTTNVYLLEGRGGAASTFASSPSSNSSFALRPLVGDIYGSGWAASTLTLAPGRHHIFVHVRAKVQTGFRCSADAVPTAAAASLEVAAVRRSPDLMEGRLWGNVLSVVVSNPGTEWLADVRCVVDGPGLRASAEQPGPPGLRLAPGQFLVLPCRVEQVDASRPLVCPKGAEGGVDISVRATACAVARSGSDASSSASEQPHCKSPVHSRPAAALSQTLRCRTLSQSATMTFVDHDGSVQHASVIAPLPFGSLPPPSTTTKGGKGRAGRTTRPTGNLTRTDELHGLPILLSLHGTGVSASSQADAHKVKPAGSPDYVFGVEGFYVLAPSRHGAHNHQGVGHFHALAAIHALQRLVASFVAGRSGTPAQATAAVCSSWRASLACLPLPDPLRVLFSGHSMGGAGAWHASTALPDVAIAIAPAAGWLVKEAYGDANAFNRLDLGEVHTSPSLAAALLASVADQRSDAHAANLAGVPAHVRVGANDATVPAWHSRRMVRLLLLEGAGSAYRWRRVSSNSSSSFSPSASPLWPALEEVRGKEHWWWDTAKENDGGVLHDDVMRDFYAAHRDRLSSAAWMRAVREGGDGTGAGEGKGKGKGAGLDTEPPAPPPLAAVALAPRFSLVVTSTHVYFGGRAGIKVLQKVRAAETARVDVEMVEGAAGATVVWRLRTSNVRRLRLDVGSVIGGPSLSQSEATSACAAAGAGEGFAPSRPSLPSVVCLGPEGAVPIPPGRVLHLCRGRTNAWSVCFEGGVDTTTGSSVSVSAGAAIAAQSSSSEDEWAFERTEKGPHTAGPARAVTASPFVIVIGTRGPPERTAAYTAMAEFLSHAHAVADDGFAPVVRDTDLVLDGAEVCGGGDGEAGKAGGDAASSLSSSSTAQMRLPCGSNLILLGGHEDNAWAAERVRGPTALNLTRRSTIALSPHCVLAGPGTAALLTLPWTDPRPYLCLSTRARGWGILPSLRCSSRRLALVVQGTDLEGLWLALRLAVPTIPPMVRSPFTNLVPDVLVAEAEKVLERGAGGIVAAGRWGEDGDWGVEGFGEAGRCELSGVGA